MAIGLRQIHHIQIFVPREAEEASKHFYSEVMGLEEITKPAAFGKHGGAWYQHGPNQLHLSVLRQPEDNRGSQRGNGESVKTRESTIAGVTCSGQCTSPSSL